MRSVPIRVRRRGPLVVAVVGGTAYAVAVCSWLSATGVSPAAGGFARTVTALAYGLGGLFLLSAVPLYLLARFSPVGPALITTNRSRRVGSVLVVEISTEPL